jgi:hypothetical protein
VSDTLDGARRPSNVVMNDQTPVAVQSDMGGR